MGFDILSIGNTAKDNFAKEDAANSRPFEFFYLGQRTRLHGKAGDFVVVGLDSEHQTADLISSSGISPVLNGVPIDRMRPVPGTGADEAFDRVLPFPS